MPSMYGQLQKVAAIVVGFSNTTAGWASSNPVIDLAVIVAEITESGSTLIKVGDGVSNYLSLPFVGETNGDFLGYADGSTTAPLGLTANAFFFSTYNAAFNSSFTGAGTPPTTALFGTLSFSFGSGLWAYTEILDSTSLGALQGILNSGNTATSTGGNIGTIILDDGEYQYVYGSSVPGFEIKKIAGGKPRAVLSVASDIGFLLLEDTATSRNCILQAFSPLTAYRTLYLPDKNGTLAVETDITLSNALSGGNTADNTIQLTNGGTAETNILAGGMNCKLLSGTELGFVAGFTQLGFVLNATSTTLVDLFSGAGTSQPYLLFKDQTTSYVFRLLQTPLTGNRALTPPDMSGEIATSGDGNTPTIASTSGFSVDVTFGFIQSDSRCGTIQIGTTALSTFGSCEINITFDIAYPRRVVTCLSQTPSTGGQYLGLITGVQSGGGSGFTLVIQGSSFPALTADTYYINYIVQM